MRKVHGSVSSDAVGGADLACYASVMITPTHRTNSTSRNAARSPFETMAVANPSLENDHSPILPVRTVALLGLLIIIAALVANA